MSGIFDEEIRQLLKEYKNQFGEDFSDELFESPEATSDRRRPVVAKIKVLRAEAALLPIQAELLKEQGAVKKVGRNDSRITEAERLQAIIAQWRSHISP